MAAIIYTCTQIGWIHDSGGSENSCIARSTPASLSHGCITGTIRLARGALVLTKADKLLRRSPLKTALNVLNAL